jgi:UDP-N-acetyl-2-amino-2-deoxyglucuronate dehydrogenase
LSETADVRLAVVGCGTMGAAHAWAAANDPRCTVTCFVDTSREKAEALAARYGGAVETDYRRALDDPGLTGVVIALPHRLHHPVAMDAFAAGKHVMGEGNS